MMDPERLVTAAPALILGAVMAISGAWAIAHAIRGGEHHTRSGIRRLERCANHPGARALHADPRKEKP
ncbi:hypothetical protein [Streptomyces sp. NPDC006355]|uniref:hypothetical protein n=1 Tax=Streptomyces sp. NPDC006355 TaxID=3156758 RepID=UPI0033AD9F23